LWPELNSESKPLARRWWPNNKVDTFNIKAHLEAFAVAGMGGVGITPAYGVKREEERETPIMIVSFPVIQTLPRQNTEGSDNQGFLFQWDSR